MKKVKGITHQEVMAKGFKNEEERAGYEEARHEIELALLFQDMREKAGVTRVELAQRMGVTPPVVSRLERNIIRASIATLERYAAACGAKIKIQVV